MCVLGGAGFIGSHLVDALLPLAKQVGVVDDLSSGSRSNLPKDVEFFELDLRNYYRTYSILRDYDLVFHLASDVGGRAYITDHRQQMWENLELDGVIFRACADAGVKKVVYFSSACVYPKISTPIYESDVREIERADGVYGMQKRISEIMLKDFPFNHVAIRPFTVYGTRMRTGYAISDLISKTLAHQDPFEVWGDGHQRVDWIYVKDLVKGVLLATEKLDKDVANLGSGYWGTPISILELIWQHVGWRPQEIKYRTDMPVSPMRIADTAKMQRLGWKADFSVDGLYETIDWMKK